MVTDPGSPLDKEARAAGYRVVNADPNVGGRYSALTAFGLVPSGLAGADIEALLDEAESVADLLAEDDEANPGLRLAAAMAGTSPLRDKLAILDSGSGIVGFADWAEQLIAESTGKNGTGVLPVVVADADDPEVRWPAADVTVARLVGDSDETPEPQAAEGEAPRSEVHVSGALGAQMLLWEVATAAAGRLLGINPFDQPDVESAKKAARGLLDASGGAASEPAFTDGAIEVRALGGDWLGSATTVATALDALFDQLDPHQGYVAVMAYLDRLADAAAGRAAARRWPAVPGGRRPSAGVRASCTRPASSTRAARPPASTCRSPPPPTRTCRSPGASSPSATSSPPRPVATPRCWPTTAAPCCACTSPTTTRVWPS